MQIFWAKYNDGMRVSSLVSMATVLLGAGLEYYAYMLFTVMTPIISPIFSGSANGLKALSAGYFIIFLGALARPIGGLLLGYIGDKKGRSVALFWSMIIMALASCSIAFIPTYAQIGVGAAVILTGIRMLQTMSAAGELNGSAIFLIETMDDPSGRWAKKETKGLASGLAWSFTVLGMFAASVVFYNSSPTNWKWGFLLGGVVGLFAMILRFVPKSVPAVTPAQERKNFNFKRSVTASILIAAGLSGMFYYNMIFMPAYFQCNLDPATASRYGMYYFLVYAVMLLFGGMINDYMKKKHKLMLAACLMLAILAVPTIYIQDLRFNLINVMILAFYVGPSHAVLYHLFPREYRYRSVSTAYSIGTSIFGGITPAICSYFGGQYKYFPALWLMFVAGLGVVGVMLGKKSLVDSND